MSNKTITYVGLPISLIYIYLLCLCVNTYCDYPRLLGFYTLLEDTKSLFPCISLSSQNAHKQAVLCFISDPKVDSASCIVPTKAWRQILNKKQ